MTEREAKKRVYAWMAEQLAMMDCGPMMGLDEPDLSKVEKALRSVSIEMFRRADYVRWRDIAPKP
jgi:hypothetical protein